MTLRDDEYDHACGEIEEDEREEYENFVENCHGEGIEICRFDGLPCNMIGSTVGRWVCIALYTGGKVPTLFTCGRMVLKGDFSWGGRLHDKVFRQKVLEAVRGKSSPVCLFNGKRQCSTGLGYKEFPNGCVQNPDVFGRNRLGIDVPYYCFHIRFKDSKVTVGDKLRGQWNLEILGEGDV